MTSPRLYRFRVDFTAHLATGQVQDVTNFPLSVEGTSLVDAQANLVAVLVEAVHDAGDRVLVAPLDWLEVVQVERV